MWEQAWVVAEQATCAGVVFLSEQAEVVAHAEQPLEQLAAWSWRPARVSASANQNGQGRKAPSPDGRIGRWRCYGPG